MTRTSTILLYGAYGYTGELIARLAREQGTELLLAGRSLEKLQPLARETGFAHRVFGLDDPTTLAAGLDGVDVVIHAAGPFGRTSAPMADACLKTGTHYTDITGEIEVFEALAARDAEARAASVMLMPGTGFDVVPSDCLAVHLKQRLPDADKLVLAFAGLGGGVSHGTAMTMVENIDRGSAIRRDGQLVPIRTGSVMRDIDMGRGPRPAMAIPWGDLATAWRSTGIPNIEVYAPIPKGAGPMVKLMGRAGPLLGSRPAQRLLKWWVDSRPAGPDAAARAKGRSVFVGEATNPSGERVRARLTTPEGYTLTAVAALEIARRVVGGDAPIGYQTPAMAYGSGLVTELPDVTLEDLD